MVEERKQLQYAGVQAVKGLALGSHADPGLSTPHCQVMTAETAPSPLLAQ
jgi:hypothetical protein